VDLGVGVEQFLDDDLVLPAVAEVVGVAEPVADVADQLAEAHVALVGEPELEIGQSELVGPAANTCM
jgi:hypothetical protein